VRLTACLQKAISFLSALNFKLMLLDLNILDKNGAALIKGFKENKSNSFKIRGDCLF